MDHVSREGSIHLEEPNVLQSRSLDSSLSSFPGRQRCLGAMDSNAQNAMVSELFAMGPVQFSWPTGVPKIRLLNRDFGHILSIFPRKNSKTQSSLNFFSPDPGNLLNLIFRDWPRSGEF